MFHTLCFQKSHSRQASLVTNNSRSSSRAGSVADVNRTSQEPIPWSYRPTLVELDKARRKEAEKKKDLKKKVIVKYMMEREIYCIFTHSMLLCLQNCNEIILGKS